MWPGIGVDVDPGATSVDVRLSNVSRLFGGNPYRLGVVAVNGEGAAAGPMEAVTVFARQSTSVCVQFAQEIFITIRSFER